MKTFVQDSHQLTLTPTADVNSGIGFLFGAGLFGVAVTDAKNGIASAFRIEGIVTIAKTSALAISVGDRLFWDPGNKVVNKTSAGQQQVGVAVEAAGNPSPTVKMKIGGYLPVAT
jgi:predicted RecA/RadA family phage recombinase